MASLVIAIGGGVTAISLAMSRRAASRRLDAYQRDTISRLNVIHTLVNSTLTAAKDAELAATRRELAMLLDMTNVQTDAGHVINDDRRAAIGALRLRIDELTTASQDRAAQTRAANVQIEIEHERLEQNK
jgi:hypothetical protein